MPFGASRHVVSLIRSPIMTDAVWRTLTCGITYSVQSPIMTDAVWCIPTRGITYSVYHHDGCYLVHPDMWYQLNAKRHHDGCRLVHPAKWEHFFNVIHHHDGCRLVHPAKWDIGQFQGAIVTDAVWCIPSGGLFDTSTHSYL